MAGDLLLKVKFAGIDRLSGMLDGIGGATKRAGRALSETNRELRQQKAELRDVQRQIAAGTGNLTQLIDRERQLEHAVERGNRELARRRGVLDRASAAQRRFETTSARGARLSGAGRAAVGPGLAGAAGVGAALMQATNFGSGLVDIAQKSGANGQAQMPIAQVKALGEAMMQIAHEVDQLPTSVSSAADTLLSFGATADQTMAMLRPIGKFATAYKTDTKDLASASFALVSNLGVLAGDTTLALDAMAVAGKGGKVEIADMARAFPGLAASAAALGAKGVPAAADLAAALETVGAAVGNADEAANDLQNLMAKASSPEVIKNFAKVGIDLPKALKKAVADGRSPIEEMARLTQKATGGDNYKLGSLFQDMQVQGALKPLMANLEKYTAMRDAALKGKGTTESDFAFRMAYDPAAQARQAQVELQRFAIVVGTQLLPALSAGAEKAASMLTRMSAFAEAHPIVAKVALAVVGLTLAFAGLGMVGGQVMQGFAFIRFIGSSLGILRGASVVFGVVRTAALFLARGVMQAGLMMLTNPLVLAVVAIGAAIGVVGYLVYRNWDKIKAGFMAGWTFLKGLVPQFLSVGKMILMGLISGLSPIGLVKHILRIGSMAVAAIKNLLGIKSPSRVFAAIGGHMAGGLTMGLERGADGPVRRTRRLAGQLASAMAIGAATPSLASGAGGAGTGGGGPRGMTIGEVHIHIRQQPGQDATDLARAVRAELASVARGKARAAGSSYEDRA